jgi:WD40 repeat protein
MYRPVRASIWLAAALWLASTGVDCFAQTPASDTGFLIVRSPTASVMAGTRPIAQVRAGQRLPFTQKNGNWYLVEIRHEGQIRKGWISGDNVLLEPPGGGDCADPPAAAHGTGFTLIHTLRTQKAAFMVAVTPDGRRIVTAGIDGKLQTWDAATGQELSQIQAHKEWAAGLSLSPDGRLALTSGNDTTVRLWDLAAGRELRRFEGHGNNVWSVVFSADGKRVLSGSHDKTMRLWDVATGQEVRRFEGSNSQVWGAALSPDGGRALSAEVSGAVRLWDVETGQQVRTLTGLSAALTVAFSPDGAQVLAGGTVKAGEEGEKSMLTKPGLLLLWDAETGTQRAKLEGHTAAARIVAFSPDGWRAVTSGYDKTVRLWDLRTEKELARYDWPWPAEKSLLLFGVAFTPDGRRVVVAGSDGSVRLLEIGG